ncbi:MAG TPA: hypothetical protein VGA75_01750 [Paracoccaceae bacterium]
MPMSPALKNRAPKIVLGLFALGLSACAPTVPESGAGVGFEDYPAYLRQREAALMSGAPVAAAPVVPVGPTAPAFSTERLGAAIDAAEGLPAAGGPLSAMPGAEYPAGAYPAPEYPGAGSYAADRPRGDAPAGIAVQSGEMTPGAVVGGDAVVGSAAISDEQDFSAVAARETIESDAERLARNRAQYQVIAPTDLPQRSGAAGPNIVEFALSTSHAVGTPVYKRSSLRMTNPNAACAKFASPDLAQEAFLASGGPDKDRKGLDPDGDGYACAWDPRPFRAALN